MCLIIIFTYMAILCKENKWLLEDDAMIYWLGCIINSDINIY